MQEARAASALGHPNIAVIHDVGEKDGVSFIAMELVRGGKLSAAVEARSLTTARALEIPAEIAEALARAHAQGRSICAPRGAGSTPMPPPWPRRRPPHLPPHDRDGGCQP
jgi:serine/threonine protein kinase